MSMRRRPTYGSTTRSIPSVFPISSISSVPGATGNGCPLERRANERRRSGRLDERPARMHKPVAGDLVLATPV